MKEERAIGLQVEQLTIWGRDREILRDLSVPFHAGEFVALIGRSGAGKSSLLRTLGLSPPSRKNGDRGIVSMAEGGKATRISGKNHQQLLDVLSYVPQEDVFPESAIVLEILSDAFCFAGIEGDPRAVSESVGLAGECLQKPCAVLSGGQKRRLSVARALCSAPRIMLLDEPTSGLDLPVAFDIMQLLRNLCDEKKLTIITTSHQPETLVGCDRVLVMGEGGVLLGDYADFSKVLENGVLSAMYERKTEITPVAEFEHLDSEVTTHDRWEKDHFLRIFWRSLRKALRNRGAAWVAVGQPVILAGLIVFTQSLHGTLSPAFINFFLTIAALWIGMSITIREIVVERPLYAIDELNGLGNASYFLAKVAFAAVMVTVSTVLLCVAAWVFVGLFQIDPDAVTDSDWFDARDFVSHLLVLGLICFSGAVLSLILSSFARTEQGAIGLMPLVLLPHVLLSKYATGYAGEPRGESVSHPFHSFDSVSFDQSGFTWIEMANFLGGLLAATRHGVAVFDQLGSSRFTFGQIFGLDFLALVGLILGQLILAYLFFSHTANSSIRHIK